MFFSVITSAILIAFSVHPLGLSWVAFFGLVPILFTINKNIHLRTIAQLGLIWGAVYASVSIFWLIFNVGTSTSVAILTLLLAVIIISIGYGLIFFLFGFVIKKTSDSIGLFLLPFIWISIEYLRSYGLVAFPWLDLANTQIDNLYLIQNAEFVGSYGISFIIVVINIFLYNFLKELSVRSLVFIFLIISLPSLSGYLLYTQNDIKYIDSIDIGIVQPNISLEKKTSSYISENFDNMLELSYNISNNIDLLVWPETAMLVNIFGGNWIIWKKQVEELVRKNQDMHLVSGIPYYKNGQPYNSAVEMSFKDSLQYTFYHKIKLVPGAEYVPNFMSEYNLGGINFFKGNDYKIFSLESLKYACMICYESTFSLMSSRFIQEGADFLVYIVNDGWYEVSPEPQQHAKQAILRAIETRKFVVRSANTGISMIVDPKGNIVKQLPLNYRGTIQAQIFKTEYISFYSKFGKVIYLLITCITMFSLIILGFRKNDL